MKIVVVSNYYYPEHTGGIETVSYNLIKQFREAGHTVCWIAADVPPRFREAGTDDVPIRSWNITEEKLGFPQPIPHPAVFVKLYRGIKDANVVHLHDCLYIINIFAFLTAKLLGKPILITQHAKFIPYKQFYKRFLQKVLYRTIGWLMFTTADKVVFATTNVRDNMRYINPEKLHEVVPLGVDTDFYSPLPDQERTRLREQLTGDRDIPILIFVGRMVERKGIHLIRPLVEKYPEWCWILVGRPDDLDPTTWECQNLRHVSYATEQQLREFYGVADLLVHPSVGEGLTLIASESLAAGTPVLLSHESLYEVDAKERDLFFAVTPVTSDIEEKLVAALADRAHLFSLRKPCREFALNRLSWRKMADHYLSEFTELVNKP